MLYLHNSFYEIQIIQLNKLHKYEKKKRRKKCAYRIFFSF